MLTIHRSEHWLLKIELQGVLRLSCGSEHLPVDIWLLAAA